jgi:hypothetical protein
MEFLTKVIDYLQDLSIEVTEWIYDRMELVLMTTFFLFVLFVCCLLLAGWVHFNEAEERVAGDEYVLHVGQGAVVRVVCDEPVEVEVGGGTQPTEERP